MALARSIKVYQHLIQERPYLVQTVQTASLMCLGDVISQYLAVNKNHSHSQINGYRVIKFGSIGLVLGPILTKWYRVLDKISTGPVKTVFIKKVVLDQLCFAPIAIAGVTVLVALIDGKTKRDIEYKLKQDYFHILIANYKLWPFVQCVNFSLVPLNYRVLVTQTVAVGWNAYLSWKLNSDST